MAWIGFDFDGTLVGPPDGKTDGKTGHNYGPDHQNMVDFMRGLVSQGFEVRIFSARGCDAARRSIVEDWLEKRGFPKLAVTDRKDFEMVALFDDLAIPIHCDTGQILTTVPNANHLLRHTNILLVEPTSAPPVAVIGAPVDVKP